MEKLAAEVVIVGSGVAGSLIAARLARAGIDVLILEAGPRLIRGEIVENFRNCAYKEDYQAPYRPAAYALHPQYSPANNYLVQKGPEKYEAGYLRLAGGTTWHWAGMAWRLLPNDFKMRSVYGVGRDWPLTYEDLEPYYYEAEVEMGVAGPNDGLRSPRSKPYPLPELPLSDFDRRFKEAAEPAGYWHVVEPAARNTVPYDNRPACAGNNNCMPICPIGAQYSGEAALTKAEREGARLVTEAVVYRVEHDARDRIVAVHYKDPTGTSHRVTGNVFVLAANGIETPKLLLFSASDRFPRGLGNRSDQVGRNLMDHPGTSMTFLAADPVYAGRGPMELSCIINYQDGAFRSDHSAFKINVGNASPARDVTRYLLRQGVYGAELDRKIRDYAARWVGLSSFLDILPDPENRIVLSAEHRDVFGIPYPEMHYRIHDYVDRGAAVCRDHYARLAGLLGGTELHFSTGYANNNHIMGTLIMGSDPADSVVDATLRCHDHPNLFIASSGVMPSAGTVNCTLTVAALSLRLSDLLMAEVGHF